eukprot:CAMPEP_0194032256 /NCGR_PEP_ID=MMETSP0009_2-20130614/5237_1 /TAXON_ID=210454 /ORGANISM="Grammatophora oceanica, Strain CCMP 410" /LENGTH=706 /DNA_ID=CAMNT_0038672641 /DNA_START=11 /DNA_END=2131 /DNA_ORIENTATION=+
MTKHKERTVSWATPSNSPAPKGTGDTGISPTLIRSSSSTVSKSLRSNLMRVQKNRDPLYYYEVVQVLGIGSMGSVAKVRKRDEVIGGSARKEVVNSIARERQLDKCFEVPLFGGLFRACFEPFKNISRPKTQHQNSILSSIRSTSSSQHSPIESDFSSRRSVLSSSTYEVTYALKSIHLNRVKDPTFVEELKNEVSILKTLDHPNIVRPIESFEHRNQLFVVMELCSGGDLYTRDPYTEEEAARIVGSILSAISFMHQHNIIHRDLKFENILFTNSSPTSDIKLIDFGLSSTYATDKELTEGVGTVYTMAPEVLRGNYREQSDLWSLGVITFMLLSSQMPFYGRKRRHIVEQIMKCQYEFRGRRWKRVSKEAKEIVHSLLVLDPTKRATADEALASDWLSQGDTVRVRQPSIEELLCTTETFIQYASYSKLKKLALMVIAHRSSSTEIGVLRKVFERFDKSRDGIITFQELQEGLSQYGLSQEQLARLFDELDLDGTGKIRWTEFVAASIEAHGAIDESRLAEAFDRLDSDDSGFISAENLQEILGEEFPEEEIRDIIAEADLSHDNKISYGEFLALWGDRNEERRDIAYRDLRQNQLSTMSTSSLHSLSPEQAAKKAELSSESARDDNTLARSNFVEGKKMSERRVDEATALQMEEAKKLLFNGSAGSAASDGLSSSNGGVGEHREPSNGQAIPTEVSTLLSADI